MPIALTILSKTGRLIIYPCRVADDFCPSPHQSACRLAFVRSPVGQLPQLTLDPRAAGA